MKLLKVLAAVALSMGMQSANATTFTFHWSSLGSTPSVAGNAATVTGTFTIDKAAGESFTNDDITNVDLVMKQGPSPLGTVLFDTSFFGAGSIAADGKSIEWTNLGFGSANPIRFFICDGVDCFNSLIRVAVSGVVTFYAYENRADLLASFKTSPVPVPGALAFFATGLAGGVTALRRRKKDALAAVNA